MVAIAAAASFAAVNVILRLTRPVETRLTGKRKLQLYAGGVALTVGLAGLFYCLSIGIRKDLLLFAQVTSLLLGGAAALGRLAAGRVK